MEYKRTYTKEETAELVQWFSSHKYPQELDLGHGISITELDKTVHQFSHFAINKFDNPNFSGPITMLFRIREELIKRGLVAEE